MKVYQLRLIMGKATNYDQTGKLKNHVMTVKYAGELELENILEDQNWKKLGACEISCVDVYDSDKPSVSITADVNVMNARINSDVQAGIKPKTEIELLKEQIASLTEKVNSPGKEITGYETTDGRKVSFTDKEVVTEKPAAENERMKLFTEAKELNLTPAKNIKTDILKDLIANAKKEKV